MNRMFSSISGFYILDANYVYTNAHSFYHKTMSPHLLNVPKGILAYPLITMDLENMILLEKDAECC